MGSSKKNFLIGKLLLAMPGIGDPRFDHAVIYICAHDENGAMGLAVNQSAPGVEFDKVLEQLGVSSDIAIDFSKFPRAVMHGGPVDPGRGFLLHTPDYVQEETVRINDHYHVTGTIGALEKIACGEGPENFLFILGYAGWQAGQLEQELQQNAWLVCEPRMDIVFDADMDGKWARAVRSLGVDPTMLSSDAGRA
ncbi:MAG: YqgE/AlgH family protein [Micavibrio sp.]|nr:YqgE/AlgH family protein [Micavibrio sp.]